MSSNKADAIAAQPEIGSDLHALRLETLPKPSSENRFGNVQINGGNVHLGDTYLLDDEVFKSSSAEQQRSALFSVLSFAGSNARLDQLAISAEQPVSYDWVQHTQLFDWLRDPNSAMFHIVGKPASGKSMLTKYLTDSYEVRQQLKAAGGQWEIIRFFFDFRAGKQQANDVLGMIKQFLRQLIELVPTVKGYLQRHEIVEKLQSEDVAQYIATLAHAVEATGVKVCAFIDGVDEYEGGLWNLVRHLDVLRRRSGMKICVASRPEPELMRAFRETPSLIMQEHNHDTIYYYLTRRLDEIATFEPEIEALFTNELREELVRKADGVVLWAIIVVEELLLNCRPESTVPELFESLNSLTPDLGSIYDRILDRIPQKVRPDAAMILILLLNGSSLDQSSLEILMEAVEFCKSQIPESLPSILGGSSEDAAFRSRITIYLSNLVQVVPAKIWFHGGMAARLIHKSLASHLETCGWLAAHAPATFFSRYMINKRQSLIIDVLIKAADEDAMDIASIASRDKSLRLQSKGSDYCQGCFHCILNGPITMNASFRGCGRNINNPKWKGRRALLRFSVDMCVPELLECSEDFIPFPERRKLLNLPYQIWHVCICIVCIPKFRPDRYEKRLKNVQDLQTAGFLDLALAVTHGKLTYFERALSTIGRVSKSQAHLLRQIVLEVDDQVRFGRRSEFQSLLKDWLERQTDLETNPIQATCAQFCAKLSIHAIQNLASEPHPTPKLCQ